MEDVAQSFWLLCTVYLPLARREAAVSCILLAKMKPQVLFGTGNAGKIAEAREVFGTEIDLMLPSAVGIPADFSPEEDGTTFEENAEIKAHAYAAAAKGASQLAIRYGRRFWPVCGRAARRNGRAHAPLGRGSKRHRCRLACSLFAKNGRRATIEVPALSASLAWLAEMASRPSCSVASAAESSPKPPKRRCLRASPFRHAFGRADATPCLPPFHQPKKTPFPTAAMPCWRLKRRY